MTMKGEKVGAFEEDNIFIRGPAHKLVKQNCQLYCPSKSLCKPALSCSHRPYIKVDVTSSLGVRQKCEVPNLHSNWKTLQLSWGVNFKGWAGTKIGIFFLHELRSMAT